MSVIVVVCSTIITVLAACGGNTDNKEDSNVNQTSEKMSEAVNESSESEADSAMSAAMKSVLEDEKEVKVVFWTGTGSANYPYLENMVQAFMEKYPNRTVELSNQGAIADLLKN